MAKSYYALSSYNSKKREWEDETTRNTLVESKKLAKYFSLTKGRRIRIVQETIIEIYVDGKETLK